MEGIIPLPADSMTLRVCPSCAAASDAAAADANACTTCGGALRAATAFDCARLGLLAELQALAQVCPSRRLALWGL